MIETVSQRPTRMAARGAMDRRFTLSLRAFSNLAMSLWPLSDEPAARKTYLMLPLTFSFQVASHVTFWSCWIAFHLPGTLGIGTGASLPMLIVMSSGRSRNLCVPFLGCSPRPRKRPGGSTRKLPTFSFRPSRMQNW